MRQPEWLTALGWMLLCYMLLGIALGLAEMYLN